MAADYVKSRGPLPGERMPDKRPKVVIIGAGFGGLEAAKALRRRRPTSP